MLRVKWGTKQSVRISLTLRLDSFSDEDMCVSGVSDCGMDRSCPVANTFLVITAQSALIVAFDTLVVALTFYKTYQLARDARRAGIQSGLGEVILRDGEFGHFLQSSSSTDQKEPGLLYFR